MRKRGDKGGSQVYGPCRGTAGLPLTDMGKTSEAITCFSVSPADFA